MSWSKFRISALLTVISFFNFFSGVSQNVFVIENDDGEYMQKFELVNDLVIIPVELNGKEMSFLLDTGVDATILFSFPDEDSEALSNLSVIYLKGLGEGEPLRALKSAHNELRIGEIIDVDHSIYILEGGLLNISNRLGVPVNGILGYHFFKDFVVEFNYNRERMKVFEKGSYISKKCRRCEIVPLRLYKNKPYIQVGIKNANGQPLKVDMLVDSGSGDAMWLFEDSDKNITVTNDSFEDFLGFGISGSVYGKRSRLSELKIGKFSMKNVTVSYPDSLYTKHAETESFRDGTIGAQILKRFHSTFDYSGRQLILRPNKYFGKPFEYNMSGVVLEHSGYRIVKNDPVANPAFQLETTSDDGISVYRTTKQVQYTLESSYAVAEIRPGSPADLAGLRIGDEILSLNKRPVYKYNLQKLAQVFSSREGRRIKLEIMRGDVYMEIEFRLKRRI